jgi:type II secretory pathway pseudopilin PulG
LNNDGDIEFEVRRAEPGMIKTARITGASGFTYIALLAIITIIGISLGATGKYWQNVMLRDREEELLFRGDQYRIAIEHYYYAIPGKNQYPQSIEDLLTDNRSPAGKHHLRRKYKDPMTNEDFIEIRDPLTKRIIGVHSASDKAPLKQAAFNTPYEEFVGRLSYNDWQFLSTIKIAPGGVGISGIIPKVPITIPTVTR